MAFSPEVQLTRTVGKLNEQWVRKLMEHEMTEEVELAVRSAANLAEQIAERRGDGKFSIGELRKAMAGETLDNSPHDPKVIPLFSPTDGSAPSPQDWQELRRKFFIANILADRSKDGTFSIEELECAIRMEGVADGP